MSRRLQIFDVGDRRRFNVTLLDSADAVVDPVRLVITSRSPSGTESMKRWIAAGGGDAEVVKVSTGVFYREVPLTEDGDWTILAEAYDATGSKETIELKINVRDPVVSRGLGV